MIFQIPVLARKAASIEMKIKKICDAFKARVYPLPDMDNSDTVRKLMNDNYSDMLDARTVLVKVKPFPVGSMSPL